MNEYVSEITSKPRCVFGSNEELSSVIEKVKQAGFPSYAFVVDGDQLRGYIKVVELWREESGVVGDILKEYEPEHVKRVYTGMTVKEFVWGMAPFPPAPLPVLDEAGCFSGAVGVERITGLACSGWEEEVNEAGQSMTEIAKQRILWLLITFVSAFLSVIVIDEFADATSHIKWAPALMPVCGAMGGNAGLQVGTAVIEAMSKKKLRPGCSRNMPYITKELIICTTCGFFFAVLFGFVAGWFEESMAGLMTGLSLFLMFIWAALGGTLIPLLLSSIGIDPVVSVGPVLTTLTDLVGYAIFLGLCTLFVPMDSSS